MKTSSTIRPIGQSLAVVIFGSSQLPYLQFLKPGYQHCMIATQDGGEWQLMDPLSNGLVVIALGPAHIEDILCSFRERGFDAVAAQRRAPIAREMPIAPFTCVEAVKRALGLHARWIITPWQLRRALAPMNKIVKREKNIDTPVIIF